MLKIWSLVVFSFQFVNLFSLFSLPSGHTSSIALQISSLFLKTVSLILQIFISRMDVQCEKSPAFSLQSIFNQVLKPLDVKTKFYNAEVSQPLSETSAGVK